MLNALLKSAGLITGHFSGGIHPSQQKLTENSVIVDCPLPSLLILPIKQHIGAACEPLVKAGDHVLRGQKIAKSQGYVSVPIHAPTSGTVMKVEEHKIAHPSGMGMPCIFIEPDGKDEWDQTLEPMPAYRQADPSELRERIRLCGLAGLGGAVFPTFIKLVSDHRHPIETVILNGIECEPYLTTDHRLMIESAKEIVQGLDIIMHMVGAESGIIAIEDNKPDAVTAIQQVLDSLPHAEHVRVEVLPTRYPQGSEKQLIQTITGKQVPAGKLPMHVGVICQNVGTTKAIHDAVLLGQPLTERVVTVSGDAVPNPANFRMRFGTPMRFAFAQCGLESFDDVHLIHGGPMMGERLRSVDVPTIKSSNGLLALKNDTFRQAHAQEQPCIRCGHCSEVCPINLVPNLLADFCRQDQFEKAEDYQLFDCIECGCCSYVCPSHIPLVHYFRYGKGQIAGITREKSFAEISRDRSESRDNRMEREKAEKAAKRKRVREKLKPKDDDAKVDVKTEAKTEVADQTQAAEGNISVEGAIVKKTTVEKKV
ncbi:MAG: electron transport complex subunit RsxC [Mariprofundaceae bacterium]